MDCGHPYMSLVKHWVNQDNNGDDSQLTFSNMSSGSVRVD